MDDSSSIVKSGPSDIVGQDRSVGDLLPVDNSTETTAITPEQVQSIRNGLNTTIILTEQIVDVLSKSNDKLSRDIKKVRNLKRRVNRKIPTGLGGVLGGKFFTELLKKPKSIAKGAGTSIVGALGLEAAAALLGTSSGNETDGNLGNDLVIETMLEQKIMTMGLGRQLKRLWRRFFPNRKVTTSKSNINNKKNIKVDKSKKTNKKKINSKKIIKDLSKLKVPTVYGTLLSLGGSSYRPELEEGVRGDRARDLKKWQAFLSGKKSEDGKYLNNIYPKFESQKFSEIGEIIKLRKELHAIKPWNAKARMEAENNLADAKDKYIPQIREEFIKIHGGQIEGQQSNIKRSNIKGDLTTISFDGKTFPRGLSGPNETFGGRGGSTYISGVENSNDTGSLNKDTSTQKKIVVVITDQED